MLVFGDRRWITNLHYAFQDETNLVIRAYYFISFVGNFFFGIINFFFAVSSHGLLLWRRFADIIE